MAPNHATTHACVKSLQHLVHSRLQRQSLANRFHYPLKTDKERTNAPRVGTPDMAAKLCVILKKHTSSFVSKVFKAQPQDLDPPLTPLPHFTSAPTKKKVYPWRSRVTPSLHGDYTHREDVSFPRSGPSLERDPYITHDNPARGTVGAEPAKAAEGRPVSPPFCVCPSNLVSLKSQLNSDHMGDDNTAPP